MEIGSVAHNIISFAVEPREERWLLAATLLGELLVLDADTFEVTGRVHAHAGPIWGLELHPTLPYAAAVGKVVTLWRVASASGAALEKIHEIPLEALEAENEPYQRDVRGHVPNAMALAFHPEERRLLTRSATLATAEIAFDDDAWEQTWCRGWLASDEGIEDVAHVQYVAGEAGQELVLCLGQSGTALVADPKDRAEPRLRYRYDRETLHWAAHVEGTDYLVASDSRCLLRLDVTGRRPPLVGPKITRDHIEMVRYNKRSGRAFAPSFDRTVTEVDPVTCASKGVVVRAPYKLRQLATLERDPAVLILKCNNGALYRVDLERETPARIFKQSPNALWSAAALDERRFAVAGEGRQVLFAEAQRVDPVSLDTVFATSWVDAGGAAGSYTKRAVVHAPTGTLLLARTDGDLLSLQKMGGPGGGPPNPPGSVGPAVERRLVRRFGSAIRDIAASPTEPDIFAVCEDGRAYRVDLATGEVRASFESPAGEPLWSLAYNHDRRLLAVTERDGRLFLLDAATLEVKRAIPGVRRGKRARFRDRNRLLFVRDVELLELDLADGGIRQAVPAQQNTIEDFAWDHEGRYLVCVTYVREVLLYRMSTYDFLFSAPFDEEVPKGVLWLDPRRAAGAYPFELVVFGRTGVARVYRVWSDRLIPKGAVNTDLSVPIHDQGLSVPARGERA